MSIKEKLIELLEGQMQSPDLVILDLVIEQKLSGAGYQVHKNYSLKNLSDGRNGRVNFLVLDKNGGRCVIERDNRSPRQRSILKLKELPAGIDGFILLKNGKPNVRYQEQGIDVISAI